jgi:hypothetical protein
MSRIFLALFSSAAVIVSATPAGAQARETETARVAKGTASAAVVASKLPSAKDSTRSYDAQALRFETRWGNVSVIRGAGNSVVGTGGWFRDPGLDGMLGSSPHAVTELRGYKTNNFRGSLAAGAGALASFVGIVVAANGSNDASSPILVIGGISGMVWGAQHLSMSYSALSRALWWYNRDLSR